MDFLPLFVFFPELIIAPSIVVITILLMNAGSNGGWVRIRAVFLTTLACWAVPGLIGSVMWIRYAMRPPVRGGGFTVVAYPPIPDGFGFVAAACYIAMIAAIGAFIITRPPTIGARSTLCPHCSYDLRRSPGPRCPECGRLFNRRKLDS